MVDAQPPPRGVSPLSPARWAAIVAAEPALRDWPEPEVRASVTSTMTEVRLRAEQGAPQGLVIRAEEQTLGRGRHGRTWESPRGSGLWWSILLRPDCGIEMIPQLPLVLGVSVVTAITEHTGIPCGLKWPNDVLATSAGLFERAKIAGILAERLAEGAVVVGVGLNVSQESSMLPAGGASLLLLRSLDDDPLVRHDLYREELFTALLSQIARDYRRWSCGDWSLDEYRTHCLTLGHSVRVGAISESAGSSVEGRAVDVDEFGHLVVVTDSGDRHVVSAGDVTLLSRD